MRAMSMLMARAIKNKEYTIERVPSRLRGQVETELGKLERDERDNG